MSLSSLGPPRQVTHILKSGLRVTSPFVVPRLSGAMLFGTLDAVAVAALMTPEDWCPVRATSGPALGSIWLSDFLDSSVGPYRELTVTVLASRRPLTVPWINAFTPLAVQHHPDVVVCEYVLVLDNDHAIAYGRELHGFDKHRGELDFKYGGGHFRFDVRQGNQTAVRGVFRERGLWSQPFALAGLASAYGVGPTLRLVTASQHHMSVVTPRIVRQLRSELFFTATARLQRWHADDELVFGDAPVGRLIAQLAFLPTCVQRLLDGAGRMPLPLLSCPELAESSAI